MIILSKIKQIARTLLTALLLSLCFITTSSAQTLDRSQVIVSYSYNFAKHIKWPNENSLKIFNIALFRVNDPALVSEFKKLNNITIKDIRIKVRQTNRINSLDTYNIVFVGDIANTTLTDIQSIIEGKPVLLVTNNITDKRLVMINLLEEENQQVKFEINKANILNSQLDPQPELILLGGTEIDVAKLYRDGQTSLIKLEQQLDSQKAKLTAQQNILDIQKKQLDLQKKNLDTLINKSDLQEKNYNTLLLDSQQLNKDITDTKKLNAQLLEDLSILKDTIESNKLTIKKQNDEIKESEKQKNKLTELVNNSNQQLEIQQQQLDARQQELFDKNQSLIDQKRRLEVISANIREKEEKLSSLIKFIDEQKLLLAKQRNSIAELDDLVNAQKMSLYFLWGIVVLVIALFLLAFIAYRAKRKDNKRLAQQSHDLQIAQEKLTLAKQKAEEANHTKGVFLSLMSHELRTPLQSIMGYTALVIEELEAEGNNNYTDQLERVINNSERLLTLINNTLDLAKIEAGKMEIYLTKTNISSLIDEAMSNINPLLNKSNNQLSVNIDNHNRTPSIDYEKLLHILVNLLSNAIKFTKNGNIDITINNHPDYLKIAVSDTGIGLSEEQLKTIFYQFQQASNKNSVKAKGTGLGLSITKHFCELMGGTITVESQENIGTTFTINIPLPVAIKSKTVLEIEQN